MTNYAQLIDAQTWAFIRETERWYPEGTASETVEQQRARYRRMCRAFARGTPAGVIASDRQIGAVATRQYRPASPRGTALILYMHGGGFILGDLDSHDDVCAELCAATGLEVISVGYRLAPEHLHPAAYDDCLAVYRQLDQHKVILCGDSAGACLAAGLAQSSRGRGNLLGQVLIYPGLGGDDTKGSYMTHAKAPMLTRDDIRYYANIRCNNAPPTGDPRFAPLHATDFSGLPPTVVFAAECDPLCDDGATYCLAINSAGGDAISIVERGLVHGYLRARHSVPRAAASFARIADALRLLARQQPLTGLL